MKKLGLVVAFVMAVPLSASAGVHNMGGCGLGTMLFEQNEQGPQILAATTNGIGSNTIAISVGTSGCTKDGRITKIAANIVFAETNFASLKRDMAVGQGQYLDSLASLYGYRTPEQKAEFSKFVQTRYETLVPTPKTTAAEMIERLDIELPVRS